jgi:hypothetical protein
MYGYSFILHTVEEQRATDCLKAEACDELNAYLDTPTFEVIMDIVGWWGVSLTSLSLHNTELLIYYRNIPPNTLSLQEWHVTIYQSKAHLPPPNVHS